MAGPTPNTNSKPSENTENQESKASKQTNMAARGRTSEPDKPTEGFVKQAILSISAGPEVQLRKLGAVKVADLMSSLTKQKVDHRYLWYNFKENKVTFALTPKDVSWEQLQLQCSKKVERDGTIFTTNVRPKIFLAVAQNIELDEDLPAFIEKTEKETGREVISYKRIGKSKSVKVGFNMEPAETKIKFEGKWRKLTPFDPKHRLKKKAQEPLGPTKGSSNKQTPRTYAEAVGGQNNPKSQNEPKIVENGRCEPSHTQESGLNIDQVKSIFKEMVETLVTPLITKLIEEIGALKKELGKPYSTTSPEYVVEENTNETPQTPVVPTKGVSLKKLQNPEKVRTSPPPAPLAPETSVDPPSPLITSLGESNNDGSPKTGKTVISPSPSLSYHEKKITSSEENTMPHKNNHLKRRPKKSKIPSPTQSLYTSSRLRSGTARK